MIPRQVSVVRTMWPPCHPEPPAAPKTFWALGPAGTRLPSSTTPARGAPAESGRLRRSTPREGKMKTLNIRASTAAPAAWTQVRKGSRKAKPNIDMWTSLRMESEYLDATLVENEISAISDRDKSLNH